jgi:hypothetical protein
VDPALDPTSLDFVSWVEAHLLLLQLRPLETQPVLSIVDPGPH